MWLWGTADANGLCGQQWAQSAATPLYNKLAAAARLRGKIKGKWLLSYNDDPFIERLYRGRGVTIERLRVPYFIARHGRTHVEELLIRNY
jgi:hypothetical protein